jgi:DNA-binding MarR family transcriptional regulator
MSDAEDIDVAHDEVLASRVGYVVRRFNQAIRAQVEDGLRTLGLTTSQYAVLAVLQRHDGINNAQLARVLAVTPQTMTRILAGMSQAGLIVRQVSAHHGRVRLARLTDAGRELAARAHPVIDAAEDRLLAPLTDRQRGQLLEYMRTCADALPGDIVFDSL